MRRARRLSVLLLLLFPVTFSLPASAAPNPILRDVTGPQRSGKGLEVLAGACAGPADPTGLNTTDSVYSAQLQTRTGRVTLGLNVCWDASGGEGGRGVVSGTFEINQNKNLGRVNGIITGGGEAFAASDPYNEFSFTLFAMNSDGEYEGATGTLQFVGCGKSIVGPDVAAKLYRSNNPDPVYPKACMAK